MLLVTTLLWLQLHTLQIFFTLGGGRGTKSHIISSSQNDTLAHSSASKAESRTRSGGQSEAGIQNGACILTTQVPCQSKRVKGGRSETRVYFKAPPSGRRLVVRGYLRGSLSHLHLERESEGSLTDALIKGHGKWHGLSSLSRSLSRPHFRFSCGCGMEDREVAGSTAGCVGVHGGCNFALKLESGRTREVGAKARANYGPGAMCSPFCFFNSTHWYLTKL